MTLPYAILTHVDPQAWLVTLPVAVALIAVCLLGDEHPLKRHWREVRDMEASSIAVVMLALGRPAPDCPPQPHRLTPLQRGLLAVCIAALTLATLLSLGRYVAGA
ncbi:MAG: hypothetical protein WD009_04535 [Phycisphaeraceae bacterium]